MTRPADDRANFFWRLFTDQRARREWLHSISARSRDSAARAPHPATTELAALAEAIDRHVMKCVLFGRAPPALSQLMAAGVVEGRDQLPTEDFAAAVWRAASDPEFRRECFGDARSVLAREGYVLDEEELGKFRWFDHEKLAELRPRVESLIDDHLCAATIVGADPREVSPASDEVLEGQLHAVYLDHVQQVLDLRARAVELLGDSDHYSPGEFDAGPPPPDEVSFMAILQLIRQWGTDSDPILRDSGYSLGRLLMIVRALKRRNVTLPSWRPILDAERHALESSFSSMLAIDRPQLDERFHQSPCDPGAVIGRVMHIARQNWLRGRPILVLGDDDGISLALARHTEAEIHVIDIDERVLEFLRRAALRQGLQIHLHAHDLRQPLPDDMIGRFWLVSADPPQSAPGEVFFLERAIDALAPALGHRIYCSITPMWMGSSAFHSVLAHMMRNGFVSRDLLKSEMTFSLHPSAGRNSDTTTPLLAAVGHILNMACDVHVFQRTVRV